MSALLKTLITTLLPVLIQIAESALGVKPDPTDSSWVAGLIQEIVGLVQKYIPSWLVSGGELQAIEQFVAAEVEKLLGSTSSS